MLRWPSWDRATAAPRRSCSVEPPGRECTLSSPGGSRHSDRRAPRRPWNGRWRTRAHSDCSAYHHSGRFAIHVTLVSLAKAMPSGSALAEVAAGWTKAASSRTQGLCRISFRISPEMLDDAGGTAWVVAETCTFERSWSPLRVFRRGRRAPCRKPCNRGIGKTLISADIADVVVWLSRAMHFRRRMQTYPAVVCHRSLFQRKNRFFSEKRRAAAVPRMRPAAHTKCDKRESVSPNVDTLRHLVSESSASCANLAAARADFANCGIDL